MRGITERVFWHLVRSTWKGNLRRARIGPDPKRPYWKQKDLAAVVGVNPSAIANYESGRRCPDMEVMYRLAGALRLPLAELFPWPEEIPPFPKMPKGA